MRRFIALFFSLFIITITFSQTQEQSTIEKLRQQAQQTGVLTGKIRDEKTGEDLIGASVSVINTKLGASTDIDGRFEIKRVPEGTVDIRVSFIGYETKVITSIAVIMNEPTTLDVSLSEDQGIQQQEVVISAEAIKSGEGAILAERKKAATIGDGISAEQMKRAPDATSGDALKRVTGLSVVDNKFVFIRGASERYNETMLNGASVSSTEIGKKSFAFDMIPANLLENTLVIKSASPDLPADFTGGLVQMSTLDFPERSLLKVTFSSGMNSITTFKEYNESQRGSRDWLGYDDGNRSMPDNEKVKNLGTNERIPTEVASTFHNNWAPRSTKAPMNAGLNISFGDRITLNDDSGDDRQFGYIGALSYRNSYQRTQRSSDAYYTGRKLSGTADNFSVLWGGIANLNYKSGFNKFSFKNNYNQTGEDEVRNFYGTDENTTTENYFTAVSWSERRTYSGTISGEHVIPELNNVFIEWKASLSSSHRNDPDNKEVTYYRQLESSDDTPYSATSSNRRSWSTLNGRNLGFNLDVSQPVDAMKVKFGSFYETKRTNYDINFFRVVPDYTRGADDTEPIGTIYNPDNFSSGRFYIVDDSKPEDNYKGDQQIFASYAMLDIPFMLFNNNFRLTGGARLENSQQNVIVTSASAATTYTLKNVDILPSANLTYLLNEIVNLRLAYSHTVNRPEIRELAKSGTYDFIGKLVINGNPDLKRSYIRNYDIRFEIFPEAGEIFAMSGFYKKISNAIEEYYDPSLSQSYPTKSWLNSPHARNYGWELEFRKSLYFISEYLNGLSITGNYTRIFSSVEYTLAQGGNSTQTASVNFSRPLQGQSPYMINVGLFYTQPYAGTSVNILYNKFGSRISIIGFNAKDIYEQPRDIVDLTISQPLSFGMELKLTVKNLLNKDRILTQEEQQPGKVREYEHSKQGITYGVQIGMSF